MRWGLQFCYIKLQRRIYRGGSNRPGILTAYSLHSSVVQDLCSEGNLCECENCIPIILVPSNTTSSFNLAFNQTWLGPSPLKDNVYRATKLYGGFPILTDNMEHWFFFLFFSLSVGCSAYVWTFYKAKAPVAISGETRPWVDKHML